jgi:hypothetical protein
LVQSSPRAREAAKQAITIGVTWTSPCPIAMLAVSPRDQLSARFWRFQIGSGISMRCVSPGSSIPVGRSRWNFFAWSAITSAEVLRPTVQK